MTANNNRVAAAGTDHLLCLSVKYGSADVIFCLKKKKHLIYILVKSTCLATRCSKRGSLNYLTDNAL